MSHMIRNAPTTVRRTMLGLVAGNLAQEEKEGTRLLIVESKSLECWRGAGQRLSNSEVDAQLIYNHTTSVSRSVQRIGDFWSRQETAEGSQPASHALSPTKHLPGRQQ